MRKAEAQLEQFRDTLDAYDDPLVATLADALHESDIWSTNTPDFSSDEWLDVLETAGEDLYLYAHEPSYRGMSDSEHTWYARYDGAAFIYGTKRTGELYRGNRDENAARQVRAVIDGHDVYPQPIDKYPLDECDEFQEVPGDR
ncbi:hypothetical protein C480_10270 [Natrialba aegyptia DSM 13077]|uniref:Uncharacterized protein n=2 Tax=Natrialba aegyptia TaxID=129789 RepID=M0B4M4_9EURY|nr:hypothetical protein C480_10270 [Natrialba aegyptia DSM 13077]